MTLPFPFTGNETKAGEIIDEELMDEKYRQNIEYLDTQVGTGGGGGADPRELFADAKVTDDLGVYWKRRIAPMQNTIVNGANQEGFDIEGKNRNDRFSFPDDQDKYQFADNTYSYLGKYLIIQKDGIIEFKLKEGENFFGIGQINSTSHTDLVEIYIDGVLASGYEDENGTTTTGTYSNNTSLTYEQVTQFFYGLDGKEHLITIKNNDSAAKVLGLEFIEVGYREFNPTISHTVKLKKGRAKVFGAVLSYDEGEFTFSEPQEGKANGHTGMIKIDNTGALAAVDGHSPAMTQAKHDETINFSAGAVTSLLVKNNWYFPDNGICLATLPTGQHHLFSYKNKQQPTIANHSLDGIIWGSQPKQDYTPGSGFEGGAVNTARGDLIINYWANAPIEIDSTNDKIDFSVNENGTVTSHTATIPTGFYSADLIPLGSAIEDAMQTARPINGSYVVEYNSHTGHWKLGVKDPEIQEIQFQFSSGPNSSASVHPTLGYVTLDLTGDESYLANDEKRHLAQRVFISEKAMDYPDSPKFKYGWAGNGITETDDIRDAFKRLGFPSTRNYSTANNEMFQYYPDDDSCGATFTFLRRNGTYVTAQIDHGPVIYAIQTDKGDDTPLPNRSHLMTFFISWPKGTRVINLRGEYLNVFFRDSHTPTLTFYGARQYYTKPAWEALDSTEQILKTYEVNAIQLYANCFAGPGTIVYVPDNGTGPATDDQINSITEVGSWAGGAFATAWQGATRFTSTHNDYVDINFTLTKDGGGILLKQSLTQTDRSYHVALFLTQGVMNESTDRIMNYCAAQGQVIYDLEQIGILGLPAGTYTARFKKEDNNVQVFDYTAIIIIDGEQPQKNAYTQADLNNAGQGCAYPYNCFRASPMENSARTTPQYLQSTGYREGRVSFMNRKTVGQFEDLNYDDNAGLYLNPTLFYSRGTTNNTNDEIKFGALIRSFALLEGCVGTGTFALLNTGFIDGVQAPNNYTSRNNVKNGNAGGATKTWNSRNFQKQFELACSFSTGSTYLVSDTRGFKDGMRVRLFDGTALTWEDFTITNIVLNTSFDIKQTPATITPANVTKVDFAGFHNLTMRNTDALNSFHCAYEYEKLPLFESLFKQRVFRRSVLETRKSIFKGVINNDDLFYPFHSDGTYGNRVTSTIAITAMDNANATFALSQDLKNIVVSLGSIDVEITSSKEVFEDIDGMEKF